MSEWLPIDSAPKDRTVFFWMVEKVEGDKPPYAPSGKAPHRIEALWGQWGCLWKPICWMELPEPPNVLVVEHYVFAGLSKAGGQPSCLREGEA